jgi:hypothetical protein
LRADFVQLQQARVKADQEEKSIREKLNRLEAPSDGAPTFPSNSRDSEERLRGRLAEIQQVRAVLEKQEQFISEGLKELKIPLDTTQGVSNFCPVHKIRMGVRRVHIAYGLLMPRLTDPPFDLRKRQFPFALDYWRGGCIIQGKSTALIYICPECQRAERQWISDHNQRQ